MIACIFINGWVITSQLQLLSSVNLPLEKPWQTWKNYLWWPNLQIPMFLGGSVISPVHFRYVSSFKWSNYIESSIYYVVLGLTCLTICWILVTLMSLLHGKPRSVITRACFLHLSLEFLRAPAPIFGQHSDICLLVFCETSRPRK